MDGWRLGYIACKQEFMQALLKITVNDVSHVNVFIQHGAAAAITGSQQCLVDMVAEDDRRRKLVYERLNAIDGIECNLPEGTIYAFPNVSSFGKPTLQIADEILQQCFVVVEQGAFYGATGEGNLRVCFGAESYERIEQAMDRIQAYFEKQS
jgi:aspartate aminotransferase